METVRLVLAENALLRLFVALGLGYLLGQVRILGVGFGVAGVLFAGLILGAWGGPEFALPEIVTLVGLAIFVYTLGLQAGPGFFAAFRRDGLRITILVAAALASGTVLVALVGPLLGLTAGEAAGLYCGATTNTPALAAALDTLAARLPPGDPERLAPAVGYSVAYPFGVLGLVVILQLFCRVFRIPVERERQEHERRGGRGPITTRDIKVLRSSPDGGPLDAGWVMERSGAAITRCRHHGETMLAGPRTILCVGDTVLAVGSAEALDRAERLVGERTEEHLLVTLPDVATRRILVSNPAVAGRRISDLHLDTYGAVITRVRRGDVEVPGTPDTVLELGDRVRVAAYERSLPALTRLLGDSIKTIAETDFLPLALGLSIGVLLGMVAIPLPLLGDLRLGVAGGPLLVALVLGRLGKTGKVLWGLPLEVNFTLRQFGLLLFLVGVGLRAGAAILDPLRTEGPALIALGAAATTVVALTTLLVGRFALRLDIVELLGVVAGVHTQPAALGIASGITGAEGTSLAYARVHPIATILKIIIAQGILAALG